MFRTDRIGESAWASWKIVGELRSVMSKKSKPINLIQNLATPHNNVLIGCFKKYSEAEIRLWYERGQDHEKYQWATDITHEHFHAEIYGSSINWKFIRYCLGHRNERYVVVGWSNANTRLLHFLFFLLRRPYNHWSDLPRTLDRSASMRSRLARWLAYRVLRYSNATIFCVGKLTMDYFRRLGFPESRLVNLPIFVQSDEELASYHVQRKEIFSRYKIGDDDFVLSAGSRIVHDKGYDLLIQAVALLDEDIRQHVRVLIVGSGVQLTELERLVQELELEEQVILEKWLDITDFKALIANSHVFIHPARVDSYGGTTLGMALGVPVIGSYGAGAAVDRIEQGRNGFLYQPDDVRALANLITLLYRYPELRSYMGQEARKTATSWPPERGVEIMVNNAI